MLIDLARLITTPGFANATATELRARLYLILAAEQEDQAGTLPTDDETLAFLSAAGEAWPEVKRFALHGFLKLDGRLVTRIASVSPHDRSPLLVREQNRRRQRRHRLAKKMAQNSVTLPSVTDENNSDISETSDRDSHAEPSRTPTRGHGTRASERTFGWLVNNVEVGEVDKRKVEKIKGERTITAREHAPADGEGGLSRQQKSSPLLAEEEDDPPPFPSSTRPKVEPLHAALPAEAFTLRTRCEAILGEVADMTSPAIHLALQHARWLKAGADPELDIIATIEAALPRLRQRKTIIRSWSFFDSAIKDALAERIRNPVPRKPKERSSLDIAYATLDDIQRRYADNLKPINPERREAFMALLEDHGDPS